MISKLLSSLTTIISGGKTTLSSTGTTTFAHDSDTKFSQTTRSKVDLLWQEEKDTGVHKETAQSTTITAAGGSSTSAAGGVVTETPTPPTDKTWNDSKGSLTTTGQALVGIAMTAAVLASGGTLAGALGITHATAAAAVNAGAMSFATQMTINTINNKGDVGKALENVSAKQVAVATAAAALSAGVISHISPGVTPRLDPNFKAGAGAGTKLADMGTTQSASFAGASKVGALASGAPAAATPSTWAQGFMTRLPVYGVQTVTNVAASAVLADGDPSAIGNAALGSLATVLGSEATLPLGQAYHAGQVNPFVHKLAHGAIGAGTAAISGGNVWAGAAGAVAGEVAGEVYVHIKRGSGSISPEQVPGIIQQGTNLARVAGGLAGLAAGGDPNTGANTGTIAAENNAFWVPALIAGPALYAAWQGDGNPVEGFREIAKGNDPVSQGASALTEKAVTLSAEHFPEKTAQVLHALSTVDALKDQAIDVIDNATGQRISGTLNTIPKPIRESLLGAAKAYSVVIPAAALTKLNQATKVAQVVGKVDGPKPNSGHTSENERLFSRIVDGGGLQAHEDAGGHLLRKHVGQSEQDLLTRLANEPKISGSSSFYDRGTAETAVSRTLDANQAAITDWLSGTSSRLRLDYSLPEPVGISVSRGANGAIDVNSSRVILIRDPSMPTGYKILTGFPTKP